MFTRFWGWVVGWVVELRLESGGFKGFRVWEFVGLRCWKRRMEAGWVGGSSEWGVSVFFCLGWEEWEEWDGAGVVIPYYMVVTQKW